MNKNQPFKDLIEKANIEDISRSIFSSPAKDIPAGIVVFLVALPLCLGIALASGAPLISGLISGIIGGVVIGAISQSHVSVSGPAASLSAVVLIAIDRLESFEIFLLALFIGGILQLGFGILRAGLIADYMPTNIIKGLLAAIGLILISSQIPYALGVKKGNEAVDYSSYLSLNPPDFDALLESFSPGAIFLTVLSLGILIFWDKTFLKRIKLLPPFLIVVILGVIINMIFKFTLPSFYLAGNQLVNIPEVEGWSSVITFPDFSSIFNFQVWTYAFTIALIASIASLLAIEAADNLDPHKRRSPPNRELVAQGVGNILAGLLGGIPITSVIVRSSVNIEAGAETKLSTIIHGILLTASVLFLSSVINLIPLASLAAILLLVGYKLASVAIFRSMLAKGWSQFLPFAITTVAILLTDVLLGVLIGTAASVFFLLRGNYYNPFFYEETTKSKKKKSIRLELSNEVSFLNKPAIKRKLWNLPKNSKVVIDATFSSYIDRDVLGILHDYQSTFAKENDIEVNIIGLKESYQHNSEIKLESSSLDPKPNLTNPKAILEYLMEGNQRYVAGNLVSRRLRNKELMDFIKDAPLAVVINCIDMREPLNMLLNTGIGDLIPVKAAGNLVDTHLIHTIEMACSFQGAQLVLLLGNNKNRLIKNALIQQIKKPDDPISHLLEPAFEAGLYSLEELKDNNLNDWTDKITVFNLDYSKNKILKENPLLQKQIRSGSVGMATALLERKTGAIQILDSEMHENAHKSIS
ncbi:MAG: SulP family inorganic anion transporter [Cyclobacterium sp.]|uniref:SulP family inorganic anion transporter n=1 Tax=Cyclobacterium sp. TaxID=1966343 RepID=UPI003970B000